MIKIKKETYEKAVEYKKANDKFWSLEEWDYVLYEKVSKLYKSVYNNSGINPRLLSPEDIIKIYEARKKDVLRFFE